MYEINENVRNALKANTRVEHIRGTINGVSFNDHDVIELSYSNRCSDTNDISFGLAYIGEVDATFVSDLIPRHGWSKGAELEIEWGIEYTVGEGDERHTEIEWIPVGFFVVSSAEWNDVGVSVVAYDAMSALDKDFGGLQTDRNTINGFASFACGQCGVQFEADDVINGTALFELGEKNDVKTWRDFIGWLANAAGGFATATRDGKITIRSFSPSTYVEEWLTTDRINSTFSDFATYYAGISYQNINENSEVYIDGTANPTDNYIKLGANPFIQDKQSAQHNLANLASSLRFVPFKTSLLSTLVYDLGDVVYCRGGIAGVPVFDVCIMSIDWTYKELTTFSGFGSDGNIKAGKSQTDKALNGLKNSQNADVIDFSKFVNSSEYIIGSTETEIARLRFGLVNTRDAETWAEMKMIVSDPCDLVIRYYYDGDLVEEYHPVEVWHSAANSVWIEDNDTPAEDSVSLCFKTAAVSETYYQTHNFHWHMNNVAGGTSHVWKITAQCTRGTVTIAPGDEHVIIWAAGLLGGEKWGGFFEVEENIPFLKFSEFSILGDYAETVDVTISGGGEEATRITSDGDIRTTSNGDVRVSII